MSIRVVLVENRPLVQYGIQSMLEGAPGIDVVGVTGEERECLRLAGELQPDVIIFNVRSAIQNPVAIIQNFKAVCPDVKILALADRSRIDLAHSFLIAGVQGCLLDTDEDTDRIDQAVADVFRGEPVFSSALIPHIQFSKLDLGPQELEILRLMAEGHSNESIAKEIGAARSTIRNKLATLYDQLGIPKGKKRSRRILAAVKVKELGLV